MKFIFVGKLYDRLLLNGFTKCSFKNLISHIFPFLTVKAIKRVKKKQIFFLESMSNGVQGDHGTSLAHIQGRDFDNLAQCRNTAREGVGK